LICWWVHTLCMLGDIQYLCSIWIHNLCMLGNISLVFEYTMCFCWVTYHSCWVQIVSCIEADTYLQLSETSPSYAWWRHNDLDRWFGCVCCSYMSCIVTHVVLRECFCLESGTVISTRNKLLRTYFVLCNLVSVLMDSDILNHCSRHIYSRHNNTIGVSVQCSFMVRA
jgi:hypothetical protein